MHTVVVTGTDTEVGKTYVSTLVLKQLKAAGLCPGAYKPVCSGSSQNQNGKTVWSDVQQLADAIEWTGSLDYVCPQRFHAPVAPNTAAAQQQIEVDDLLLTQGAQVWLHEASHLLIEGAGGLLSPLSDRFNTATLAESFSCPIVLVAANRLGTINHTLLTAEAIRKRGLTLNAIVVNDVTTTDSSDESMKTNAAEIQRLLPNATVLRCGYQAQSLQFASNESVDLPSDRIQQLMFRSSATSIVSLDTAT